MSNIYIFDSEVTIHDWLFVFKSIDTGDYTVIHNDNDSVIAFMDEHPVLCGFNNKHYDQFILKGILLDMTPEEVKGINDAIINEHKMGWDLPQLKDAPWFDQFDLMSDMQKGLSLKAIEGHMGMDITESTVDFNITHRWSDEELEEMIYYCKKDVDATEKLYHLRQDYLLNKINLGNAKGIDPIKALYNTNAKLTAMYLDAERQEWNDERNYHYPPTLLKEYIPQEVLDFFDQLHDETIEDVFSQKLEITVGECPVTIGYGGIHGAIPTYLEEATDKRSIRNKDVASYYPHQMTLNGYCSRNIPNPKIYADTIERRVAAKKSGDKSTANALKLVLNTTYGAMLDKTNDLYDPLMGRSVCISGQLQLLELSEHLIQECPTLKIIQLNTDGIMVSLDNEDEPTYQAITQEWQDRTGFELEEDFIKKIVQKDVNNYVEVAMDGSLKTKGGMLVRGTSKAGAFNINNNATVIADALTKYLAYGTPIEKTIHDDNDPLHYQFIAKSWSKCGNAIYHHHGIEETVQRVNRVYASPDYFCGTLYMYDPDAKSMRKLTGLPNNCTVDNSNKCTICDINKKWYIRQAKKEADAFLGIKPTKNTRTINKFRKSIMEVLNNGK